MSTTPRPPAAASQSSKNPPQRKSKPTLTWTTEIIHTRRHWWWYLVVAFAASWLTAVLVASSNWPAAAVTLVSGLALIIVNSGRAKAWQVTITPEKIERQMVGAKAGRFRDAFPLSRYRAFTTSEHRSKTATDPMVVLLPARYVGAELFLFLPKNPDEQARVLHALRRYLPFDEAPSYRQSDRVISAMTRWLGIQ